MSLQTLLRPVPEAPTVEFQAERLEDLAAIDALIDAAFGPGRFAKTAERLREGASPRRDLGVCAWAGDELVGAVRMWPVLIGEAPAVFLGPIAVEAGWRKHGVGAGLVHRACDAAAAKGEALVLLVGDTPFFGPLGFAPAPTSVRLPGPVDARRVLWRGLWDGGLDGVSGSVRVRRA